MKNHLTSDELIEIVRPFTSLGPECWDNAFLACQARFFLRRDVRLLGDGTFEIAN